MKGLSSLEPLTIDGIAISKPCKGVFVSRYEILFLGLKFPGILFPRTCLFDNSNFRKNII